MLISWLKQRHRSRILAEQFPDAWECWIAKNVRHERQLEIEQRHRLRSLMQVFIAEKNWEGCQGLTLTDEMKVTIAAQACLLVVGFEVDVYFDHVLSILVYPTAYVAPDTSISRVGIVIDEGGEAREGEAWWHGPVVLSWEHALAGGRLATPGHNLVLHEFAHQLDMMNSRVIDGTPLLAAAEQATRWAEVMEPAYQKLISDCEHYGHGLIDCYGATSRGEFFAVLTESFFERPLHLQRHLPDVYAELRGFYRLDPAVWKEQ
ncbi:hypothetical protein GC176_19920 [bacterium]|nr:hypothetical protein [bacterium]